MKKKYLLGILVVVVIVFVVLLLPKAKPMIVGSVSDADSYNATSTGSFATATSTFLKLGQGQLGSIVVSSTTAATLTVWDATSTTDSASTTIASFVASPANGTYQYDVQVKRGLFVNFPTNFKGAYTITWR